MIETTPKLEDGICTLDIARDETLRLSLPENPTTGYRWQLKLEGPPIAQLLRSEYAADPNGGIGGGGIRTFDLETMAAGTVHILLALRRAWEKSTAPVREFDMTLNIV